MTISTMQIVGLPVSTDQNGLLTMPPAPGLYSVRIKATDGSWSDTVVMMIGASPDGANLPAGAGFLVDADGTWAFEDDSDGVNSPIDLNGQYTNLWAKALTISAGAMYAVDSNGQWFTWQAMTWTGPLMDGQHP